jgi:ABC-type uncharacterized transport system YnjBCD ATPase subunit
VTVAQLIDWSKFAKGLQDVIREYVLGSVHSSSIDSLQVNIAWKDKPQQSLSFPFTTNPVHN